MRNMSRNSRTITNKLIALFTSLVLVVGLAPAMAFAGTATADTAGGLAPGAASGISGEDAGQGAERGMTAAAVVASGICGYYGGALADNLSWTLDDAGVLTISGTGPMNKYSPSGSPWGDSDAVKSVVIKDGVTSIGDYAFYGCKNLASVEMPDSVTQVEDNAFDGCAALASVVIPDSVTYIGGEAFKECSSLTSVVIPGSADCISSYAFAQCDALERVVISPRVTKIDSGAFYRCKNLKEVAIPSTVTYIGKDAFMGCPKLISSGSMVGGVYFGGTLSQWKGEVNDQGSGLPRDKTSGLHCMPSFTVVAWPPGTGRFSSFGEYSFETNKWLYTARAIILSNYVLKNWTQDGEVVGDQLCWTVAFSDDQVPKTTVANFEEGVGDACGVNLMWKLKDGVLTVYGTGEMDYRPYWDGVKDSFSSVEIMGAQNITSDAFNGRNNLKSAMIAESVTSIGASAFENCTSMSAIAYGGSEAQWGKVKKGSDWDKNTPSDKTITYAKWDVAASASPEAGGTVTGSGVYAKDPAASATLTATAATDKGYHFAGWTENGELVSTSATYEFTATADRTLVANFESNDAAYTITASANDDSGGTVSGGGTYTYGQTATLTATPKAGYVFECWMVDGDKTRKISNPELKVTVDGSHAYTALFWKVSIDDIAAQQYTGAQIRPTGVNVQLNAVDVVLVDGDYTLFYGENVNAGKGAGAVTATFAGRFTGSATAAFDIIPASLDGATVAAADQVYDGTAQKPVPTVTWGDKQVAQEDYTATYANNVRAGTATVIVTGKRNFAETSKASGTFKIAERPATITADSAERAYDGTALTADGFTSEGLAAGDKVASAKVEGSQTAVGSSANKVSGAKIVNAAGEDVTGCYDIAYKPGALTVKPAKATITVANASKVEGEVDPAFAGTVEGLVADGDLGKVAYKRTNADEAVGTYKGVITAAYTANANYDVAVRNGDFTIEEKPYDGDLSDVAGYVDSVKASMPDLDPDSWYMGGDGTRGGYFLGTDVLYLDYTLARGLMGGYTDKDGKVYAFGPNDALKRAEAVTTLYRMANKDITPTTEPAKYEANRSGLPDVEDFAYYTAAVNWAVEAGIVTGYTDESGKPYAFGPDDPLLREQVATVTWRWCTSEAVGMAQPTERAADIYDDAASISEWALEGAAFCHENGIMTGFGGTHSFEPALTTERCQMSKVIAVADRLVRIKLAGAAVQAVFGS